MATPARKILDTNVRGNAKEHTYHHHHYDHHDYQRASRQHGPDIDTSNHEKITVPPSIVIQPPPLPPKPPAWETDPREYYQTFYNQFANLIMIATFTGGVQAAILSFLNDVLSSDALKVQLFLPDPDHRGRTVYSVYSLGLMLGLLAVALDLTVAIIAAVNAALSCHFSLHKPQHKPSMEARIVFCMIILFIAFGVTGISLVLLIFKFDFAFTIIAAVLLFAGVAVSAYHIIALFGSQWFSRLRKNPLHAASLVIGTLTFVFEVSVPSPSSWFTVTTYGMTIIYHMLAVLHNRSSKADRPRKLAFFGVITLAVFWFGCAVVTGFLRRHSHWIRPAVCALSGMETAILLAIGITDGRRVWRRTSELEA